MVNTFSSYLADAKIYALERTTFEEVVRFDSVHPEVLNRLWMEAILGRPEEFKFDEYERILERDGLTFLEFEEKN